jgi:hypothetical protein
MKKYSLFLCVFALLVTLYIFGIFYNVTIFEGYKGKSSVGWQNDSLTRRALRLPPGSFLSVLIITIVFYMFYK